MDYLAKIYYVAVSFDECLCMPPKYITVLADGQAIAQYADAPAMPYDSLQELLDDHAMGALPADGIRARMQPSIAYAASAGGALAGTNETKISAESLKKLVRRAQKFYGEGVVKFTLPN